MTSIQTTTKIKRGVSLYCYQQGDFFHTMNWKDQLREVATNLNGATGVEIISECTIPHYPYPSEAFIEEWKEEIARWGLTAVTMDSYISTMQFRDHILTIEECANRIIDDLRLAHKMGFQMLRPCSNLPLEAVELALPVAEELGMKMNCEIHAPASIQAKAKQEWGTVVARTVAFIEKTGTKAYGLQPDMGIFQDRPSRVSIGYALRGKGYGKEDSLKCASEITDASFDMDKDAFLAWLDKNYNCLMGTSISKMFERGNSAEPIDLYSIFKYIFCIHGKFYEMTEIPGKLGQYEDRAIDYKPVIDILNDARYDGYINSEYEGQRDQQDMGIEGLANEVEEVRRHHEMLKRLSENDEYFIKQ